ncbi:MAG: DUF4445 domain-containing protein [Chloroflexi bacterium]|nr:DUF4445 domain-containing protein [Chloroflexota bacterium]
MPHIVDFQPVGRRGPCPEGSTLLDAARSLGVDLASICGGHGTCGHCRVQVVAGQVSPLSPREAERLSAAEKAQGLRLACLAKPLSACRVHVPPESLTALQRTQVEGLEVSVEVAPSVHRQSVTIAPPTLEDLRGDDERLHEAVGAAVGSLTVARWASPTLRRLGWQAAVTRRGQEVIHVAEVDAPWLGLAVDVGTTKVAAYLVDLTSGRALAAKGAMNPQIAYGEDVIARLMYAGKGDDEAARMQTLVADGLNRLAADACSELGVQPSDVVEAVVVGNTAIHHLFLGLPVQQLAAAPYVPAVRGAVDVPGRDLGLCLAPGAYVHLLPNIAGYVGADHVAMLLAVDLAHRTHTALAIDIGTNTEMCLIHRGHMTSLSCASGPAFEGAHIKFGMRAAPGAIERVRIADGGVAYKTIGDEPAVGICGSGLLDVVAHLRMSGRLDAKGRLGGPDVQEMDGERAFIIAPAATAGQGRAVAVTQHDIRELQLAKGAIRSGIETLLQDAQIAAADVDEVIIAGAFGTYIDVDNAMTIGLLPRLPLERVSQVGNAAGAGARLALVSQAKRQEAQEVAARVRYLELARAPRFMRNFAEGMSF